MFDAGERALFEELTEELMDFSSVGIRPGLERVSRLLYRLGSPELSFESIQVLGTNGKGSTAATIESICSEAGMRVALYTSPHLVSLQERLCVGRSFLPIELWRGAFERVKEAVLADEALRAGRPTFFETLTAMAFLMIAEASCDVAVLEAGMGGRCDATSACRALATVVTPIGIDHREYLGDTLAAIASEKFSAIRPGTPAFYSGDDASLREAFTMRCRSFRSPCFLLNELAHPEDIRCSLDGTSFSYVGTSQGTGLFLPRLSSPLIGLHQAHNQTKAISVLLALRERTPLFRAIGEAKIRTGLAKTRWPGRCEVFRPGGDSPAVILDGAHNEDALEALMSTLFALSESGAIGGVGAVVFAVMRDKELEPLIALLGSWAAPVFCTQVAGERSMRAEELAAAFRAHGVPVAGAFDSPDDALAAALFSVTNPSEIVLCCGSLFLVGHLIRTFERNPCRYARRRENKDVEGSLGVYLSP